MVRIEDLPLNLIRRPLPRQTDRAKLEALMDSIAREGLHEPIEVLEIDGVCDGFSDCHRYEAHQRLGTLSIRCRIRRASRYDLRYLMG